MLDFLWEFMYLPYGIGVCIKNIFDSLSEKYMLEPLMYMFVPFVSLMIIIILIDVVKGAFRKKI